MAETNRLNFLDFAKSKDPNGVQAQVFELMAQYNPVMQDAPAFPSNAPMGNRTTYRRSLPSVGTAKINKGVTRSKSQTDQRIDAIGYFAGRSEIDSRLMKIEGSGAFQSKRAAEDRSFEEALSQLVCNTIFYGDTKTDEASFDGLAPRMDDLNPGTSITGSQVWSQGSPGSTDTASIYVIDWGADACHLIYPPESVGGLDVQDKGEVSVDDVDGNPMFAYVSAYDWFVGLAVKDPRHIARLCNIDVSDSKVAAPTQAGGVLINSLEEIMAYMPDPGPAQRVLYCPTALYSSFMKQARSFSNQALSIQDYLGRKTPHFYEYPLRKVDQLSVTESTVS